MAIYTLLHYYSPHLWGVDVRHFRHHHVIESTTMPPHESMGILISICILIYYSHTAIHGGGWHACGCVSWSVVMQGVRFRSLFGFDFTMVLFIGRELYQLKEIPVGLTFDERTSTLLLRSTPCQHRKPFHHAATWAQLFD